MKFGLLFSGQGAQRAGMGINFLADPLFKETVEIASEASGQDIVADFKSEHDELKKTVHVQPALVAFEAGIYRMLQRDLPDFNADRSWCDRIACPRLACSSHRADARWRTSGYDTEDGGCVFASLSLYLV